MYSLKKPGCKSLDQWPALLPSQLWKSPFLAKSLRPISNLFEEALRGKFFQEALHDIQCGEVSGPHPYMLSLVPAHSSTSKHSTSNNKSGVFSWVIRSNWTNLWTELNYKLLQYKPWVSNPLHTEEQSEHSWHQTPFWLNFHWWSDIIKQIITRFKDIVLTQTLQTTKEKLWKSSSFIQNTRVQLAWWKNPIIMGTWQIAFGRQIWPADLMFDIYDRSKEC